MIKQSIGVDVSKGGFHVCLSSIDVLQHVKVSRSGTFTNNITGFSRFAEWIISSREGTIIPLIITMEATGVYYENLAPFLHKQGYHVSVVLPNKAKKHMAALNLKTKKDKADAKGLSRMGEFFYQLRLLTRHYQSLQQMRTSLNNQLHANKLCMYQDKTVTKGLEKMIRMVEAQIKSGVQAISAQIASRQDMAERVQGMVDIKGVGDLTVAVLLAETNGFELFSSASQLVSYAGYDVVENQSGSHTGKTKISKKGNGRIRRILPMPALVVMRYNVKTFHSLYERNLAKHNIKMKSYVEVQKKLLTIIYTLWKNRERFNDDY